MKKLILLTVLVAVVLPLQAKPYFKGQKEYLRECRSCHGSSQFFIGKFTPERWSELLKDKGKKLAFNHIKTKNSVEYFKSQQYVKRVEYIEAYVTHFFKKAKKYQ
ncbi:MAG: hypothetical protein DSZ03_05995 [Sulfurimonas sp.]|nr:MAG: hypothetical protein DSZ03_05995 [Sulfurimonas sp.]